MSEDKPAIKRKPKEPKVKPKVPKKTVEVSKGPTPSDPKDPLKEDFRNFLYVIWKHLNLPDPTAAQYRMAYYLQHGPKRSIKCAFRGIGKSYITVAYIAWLLYCNPQLEIMVVSAGEDRATTFSIFLKSLINDVPILQFLKPRNGQRDSNLNFDVGPKIPSGSPSVKSVGITGQLTGSRADIIVGDDIEIPRNSQTHDQREKLANLVKEFAAILKPDSPIGKIIYLGTPQTELSLYNVLETRGYHMLVYPARYPTATQLAYYGSRIQQDLLVELELNPELVGLPTDPIRFNEEELLSRELEYGRSGFALQFMLDTSLSDGNRMPLKVDDLIIYNCRDKFVPTLLKWSNNPLNKLTGLPNVALAGQSYYANEVLQGVSQVPFKMSVMTIDPAGRGADEVGYAVVKWAGGNFYVPKAGGLSGGYSDETLIELCNIAKEQGVNEVVIESNFGDGSITKLLTPHMNRIYPVTITEVRHNTQKELRIIGSLEPVMNQHRLIVDPNVIQEDYDTAMRSYSPDKAREYMLFYQLSRITKDRGSLKHDDRLEALAMGVRHFQNMLSVDQKTLQDKQREDFLMEQVRLMKQETGGSTYQQLNCIDRWSAKVKRNR